MKPLFVRVKCELGMTFEVADAIFFGIEETVEIFSTSGEYDLLAKFQLEDNESPGRFVAETLQKVKGIRDTYTIIGFRIYPEEQKELLGGEPKPVRKRQPPIQFE